MNRKTEIVCFLMCIFFIGISSALGEGQNVTIDYFQRFVIDGGLITWLVLIPLSIATFAIIVEHLLSIRSSQRDDNELYHKLIGSISRNDIFSLWGLIHERESFLTNVTKRALIELTNNTESAEYAIIEATEEQATSLFRKIEYLNIIGNVAPMIGLFGTVYGIILAFNKLVEVVRAGGVTQPDQLAEGISVALVTTFWGLIVAIPALAAYGLFRNRIDAMAAQIANRVLELIQKITPEQREQLREVVENHIEE